MNDQKYYFPRACVVPAGGGPPAACSVRGRTCFVPLARGAPFFIQVTAGTEPVACRLAVDGELQQAVVHLRPWASCELGDFSQVLLHGGLQSVRPCAYEMPKRCTVCVFCFLTTKATYVQKHASLSTHSFKAGRPRTCRQRLGTKPLHYTGVQTGLGELLCVVEMTLVAP